MKFIEDGIVYVSGDDVEKAFYTSIANFGRYRRQGMPFELISNLKIESQKCHDKYGYPVEKCRRWFAGEEVAG